LHCRGFSSIEPPSIARPVRAAVAVIFAHNETNSAETHCIFLKIGEAIR
jgi:hypothetical protein